MEKKRGNERGRKRKQGGRKREIYIEKSKEKRRERKRIFKNQAQSRYFSFERMTFYSNTSLHFKVIFTLIL